MNASRNALFGVILCITAIQPAAATLSTASLDWANMKIFAVGTPGQKPLPAFTQSGETTLWSTSATTVGGSGDTHTHNTADWSTALDITSATLHANGAANASSTVFATKASATLVLGTDPNARNTASGRLEREVTLTLTDPAAVIFSVPYSVTGDGTTSFNNASVETVSGTAAFTATGRFSPGVTGGQSLEFNSVFNGGPVTQDGALYFGVVVPGAGTVDAKFVVSSMASAPDPVPEPAAAIGVIAGLLSLGAVARRRLQNT
ncbi:MAG: PEP-CTERM sorting domain-containing protein [Betaproteobacteria bacterium]